MTPKARETASSKDEFKTAHDYMTRVFFSPKVEPKPKAKQKPKPSRNYKRLDKILEEIGKSHQKTRSLVEEYCKAALEEGFTGTEAKEYMFSKLKNVIARSTLYDWGNRILPPGSMKVTKPKNISKKIPDSDSLKSERSPMQEQKQAQKPGRWNQDPDDYEIEKVDEYDLDYSHEIIRFLHKMRMDFIAKSFEWQKNYDEMQRENKALQAKMKARGIE